MSQVRTTEELIAILDAEFEAINKGEKGLPFTPTPEQAEEVERSAGVIGALLGAERMAQVSYYHQIRDEVWEYQREHNVSGLVIEEYEAGGKTINLPAPAEQLILTADDMDVLKLAKDRAVEFFADYCRNNLVYICHVIYSKQHGEWDMQTTLDWVLQFASDMDWALLSGAWELGELSIALGYGDPKDADYTHCQDAEKWWFEAKTFCQWTDPRTIQTAEVVTLSFDEIRKKRLDGEL